MIYLRGACQKSVAIRVIEIADVIIESSVFVGSHIFFWLQFVLVVDHDSRRKLDIATICKEKLLVFWECHIQVAEFETALINCISFYQAFNLSSKLLATTAPWVDVGYYPNVL